MKMKHLTWLFLAFLIVGSRLGAMPYVIGDCVVDIEIRNTAMIPILQSWISVKEKNGNILVFARADGYATKKVEITKADGQKLFKLDLTLEDEPRHILVRDVCGAPIASAYVDKSQFGFSSDVYGITVGIPKKLLPHPSPKMVQVMGDFFWAPITKSCKIEEIEGFQKITLTVDRRDYGATQRLVSVVVAIQPSSIEDETDEGNEDDEGDVGSDTPKIWLSRLQALEASSVQVAPGSSLALAELLVNAYSPACLETAMVTSGFQPETLKKVLALKETFRTLHRD